MVLNQEIDIRNLLQNVTVKLLTKNFGFCLYHRVDNVDNR